MPSKGLADRATLVNVHTKMPGGIRTKKNASRELADQKDSDKRRTKVVTHTFKEALAELSANRATGRKEWVAVTLPWTEGADRLCLNSRLPELLSVLDMHGRECERLAIEAADRLQGIIRRDAMGAADGGMGELFDASDYPTRDEFISKCVFSYEINVVPDASRDIRAGFSADHADRVRQALEEQSDSKVRKAVAHVTERVEGVLKRLVGVNKYAGGREGSFRDSIITNAREIADLLSDFNLLDDPVVEEVRQKMIREICTVDAQDLREDSHLREKVHRDAKDLLSRMGNFGNRS